MARSVGGVRAGVLVALALSLMAPLVATSPSAGAAPPPPSVKLMPTETHVTLTRRRASYPVQLALGVYVTPVNGDFVLHVGRADYDAPILASQVVNGADVALPDSVVDGFMGLKDFSRTVLRNANGKVVSGGSSTWCPAGYARGRVDPSGPLQDPYPAYGCPYNPFTVGTVMGVADGWATALVPPNGFFYYGSGFGAGSSSQGIFANVPDGRYTAQVTIAWPYRTLFAIPAADASVTVQVRVVTRRHCRNCFGPQGRVVGVAAGDAVSSEPTPRAASVPVDTTPDPATLPDLIPLPASQMYVQHDRGRDYLVFGATVWDAGPAPMVVEGFRQTDATTMDAWQYFFDASGQAVGRARAGRLEYDARKGHQHWHFRQFARYALTDTNKIQVVRSHKEAFCLAPTDPIDLLAPNAQIDPYPIGLSSACGDRSAIWVRESLPSGWGDTYYQWLPGQAFNITDLPNGRYFVKVQVNATGSIYEADTTNDVSYRRIFLRGTPGRRRVLVPAWHGLDGPCCSAP